jgi:hypothetical protein
MELNKRNVQFLGRLAVSVALILVLAGWGKVGHQIINGSVIVHLPATMGKFIQQVSFLSQHASDADGRKGGDSQKPYILKEGPRHFIDVDSYSEFTTKSVPEDFSAVIAKYDSGTVFDFGVVPWAAMWTLDSLTAQLHRGDWQSVWQSAADLGHYVGDAHQPLHATKYYGVSNSTSRPGSGSGNIHSRYESDMISDYQGALNIRPDTVHFVANPVDFMFDIIYQSNSYVDSIYVADIYARQITGWSGTGTAPQSYYDTLWAKTGHFTQLQFQRATENYADLLYTAWVNAGSPDLTKVPQFAASSVLPEQISLGQNYPNPFNPSTKISFQLSQPARVKLTVFSILGKPITVLMDRTLSAGSYESKFDASSLSLSSGLYLYRLQVQSGHSSRTLTHKMLLLK